MKTRDSHNHLSGGGEIAALGLRMEGESESPTRQKIEAPDIVGHHEPNIVTDVGFKDSR